MTDRQADEPLEAVATVLEKAGVAGRRLRELLADLLDGPRPLAALVRRSSLPRRSVEEVLRAANADIDERPEGFTLRPDRAPAYRERFNLTDLPTTGLDDPLARRLSEQRELVTRLAEDIAAAPASREALDHVSATAETVVRRALWLDGTFDLTGRRLLCVGDHDLTSLAVGAVNPEVEVTVVDLDERILEFIDRAAASRGLRVRCLYADFRFGLPEEVHQSVDVVLTDPPYTPEGVQLFLGRGLEGLRDRTSGRLVMAYGFSDRAPALGVKVQRAVLDLELALEAILPAFNRYHGAQAVGSASDLYVCQPTARTWKVLDRRLEQATVNIYTHGDQSLEGTPKPPASAVTENLRHLARADADDRTPVISVNGPPGDPRRTTLSTVLLNGLPAPWTRKRPVLATADLSADPGPWLLRLLLAANTDRLAILVPNGHPDLVNQEAQQALAALVAPKCTLRVHRSTPAPALAVVEAVAVPTADLDDASLLARRLLDRAHGKAANLWRDGLITLSRNGGAVLTKNEAGSLVRESAGRPELLNSRLIHLPRHQLRDLLAHVNASAEPTEVE